ncbi:putative Phox domain, WH2 domain, PX domain superfamily protein [Plasmopara halstedii]
MGGGSWVVQEGFLLCKRDEDVLTSNEVTTKPVGNVNGLTELYVVLTMNRKLEFFDSSDVETRNKVDGAYLIGFGAWDGDSLYKVDSYGLELKVERNAKSRMHLAAFNRVDLEKWCRGFMAVLDPQSAAGEEVRRERRRVKKEEKRVQQEREEQIRKWKEKKARMIKEEQDRLLAREEEINNMTPLERIDDIGSLDDDTVRMLEKRRQRLQRRQAPTMGRVNKAAYRRRLEEAAGGKTENVQPLHTKMVEQKVKVRVELPPPGQFFEVGGVVQTDPLVRFGSSESDMSDCSSMSSRLSSVSSLTGSRYEHNGGNLPPPPPPPLFRAASSSRMSMSSRNSMGFPPPPPPPPLFDRDPITNRNSLLSRSNSSASLDSFVFGHDEESRPSRASFSQTSHRSSNPAKKYQNRQDNLAAILGGERPNFGSRAARTSGRRDSFGSITSVMTKASYVPDRKSKVIAHALDGGTSPKPAGPTMANAFAASLAAIRRNRADTAEEGGIISNVLSPVAANGKVRSRKRNSQLSAEGKEILRKAMAQEESPKAKPKINGGRRGLFDESSSDEDDQSDTGLFGLGARKSKARKDSFRASQSFRSSDLSVELRPQLTEKKVSAPSVSSDCVSSDEDLDHGSLFLKQPTIKSIATTSAGAGGAGPSIVVLFTMSALRNEGKKSVAVYTFTFQFGNLEHTISYTYSEFEEIHARLVQGLSGVTLPKFPSKHRLRNNTKPENIEKRAQEFCLYLQRLVTMPNVLFSEQFQFEYHIDGAFARALMNGQKPSGKPFMGTELNGRPPRSSVSSQSRMEQSLSLSSSRIKSPSRQATNVKASNGLFGLAESNSDPESDSDTSIDTPQQVVRQQRRESAASSTQRRKSNFSSSNISLNGENTQRGKKNRSRSRLSSRASSGTSFAPSAVPPMANIPSGRPNPFAGGRGDLLAAIRQGAQLKKVDSTDGSVSSVSSTAPPAATQPGSINEAITNAMAMRRIHVEYEETKSDVDSDSDSDDWD